MNIVWNILDHVFQSQKCEHVQILSLDLGVHPSGTLQLDSTNTESRLSITGKIDRVGNHAAGRSAHLGGLRVAPGTPVDVFDSWGPGVHDCTTFTWGASATWFQYVKLTNVVN